MHDDFNQRIYVKINAPNLLENYLLKKGFIPYNRDFTSTMLDYFPSLKNGASLKLPPKFIISMFGNVCDVYQPAEEKTQITRKLLQIVHDFGFPTRILTKSTLMLRDIELLKSIHMESFARIAFTITLANEKDQLIFEPNAASTLERFEALRALRKEGIPAGIYFTPVIPFIGDTEENLHSIFSIAKEAGAEFILTGGLTLRPGRNKDEFMHTLAENYSHLEEKYLKLYGNNNRGGQPDPFVAEQFKLIDIIKTGYELSKKYAITFYEPRYIPEGQIQTNLRIATVLARIAFLKERIDHERGNHIQEIRQAAAFIEKMRDDLGEMKDETILSLSIKERALEYVFEMLKDQQSKFLVERNDWNNLFYEK